jgi:hypothetical protein
MSSAQRKVKSAVAVKPVKKAATKGARRLTKPGSTSLRGLSARTTRYVKRHPVQVALGASAIGLVIAKLGRLV